MTTQYKWLPNAIEENLSKMASAFIWDKFGEIVDPEYVKVIYQMLWESATEVEQDPVGYALTRRIEEMDDVDINCVLMKNKPKGAVITALYTHPQPKREPMKKEDIMHLLEKRDEGSIIDFIRLIEKAHGIGNE
jgi:hypothetical protein